MDRSPGGIELISRIDGYVVVYLRFRGGRLSIVFAHPDGSDPSLIVCTECVAIHDGGLGSAPLTKADAFAPAGSFGEDVASTERRPEIRDFYELRIWNRRDEVLPMFRALARHIEIKRPSVSP